MNQSNVVVDTIRRATLITIIIAGLVIVVASGLLFFPRTGLSHLLRGPLRLSSQLLAETMDGEITVSYVEMVADSAVKTGFAVNSDGAMVYYHALVFADYLVLVKTDQASPNIHARGLLIPLPPDLQDSVLSLLSLNHPEIQGRLVPFLLDTTASRMAFIALFGALMVVISSGLVILRAVRNRQDPYDHPIMRDLRRLGSLNAVLEHLNLELAVPHETINSLHFTPSWIVYVSRTKFRAMRQQDIMWLYKSGGEDTSAVQVYDRFGQHLQVNAAESQLESLFDGIRNRAPWATTGYTFDLRERWITKRAAFINDVDQARRKVSNAEQKSS